MASARKRKDCFTSFLFVLPLLALFLVFFLILLFITLSSASMTEKIQMKCPQDHIQVTTVCFVNFRKYSTNNCGGTDCYGADRYSVENLL